MEGGINRYGFVQNNPVMAADPTGLFDEGSDPWQAVGNTIQQGLASIGSDFTSWGHALGTTAGFLLGVGPDRRMYGPGSQEVNDLDNSKAGDQIRMALAQGQTTGDVSTFGAFVNTIEQPWNGTQAQVGAFHWRAEQEPLGGYWIHVTNTISFNSLVYHIPQMTHALPERWDRPSCGFGLIGPMGNVYQTFSWYEP